MAVKVGARREGRFWRRWAVAAGCLLSVCLIPFAIARIGAERRKPSPPGTSSQFLQRRVRTLDTSDGSPVPLRAPVGSRSDPGAMQCGTASCDLALGSCCLTADEASCANRPDECPPGTLRFTCDEAADCPPGMKCCVSEDDVSCALSCDVRPGYGLRQLCKTDAECATGECLLRSVGTSAFWACR